MHPAAPDNGHGFLEFWGGGGGHRFISCFFLAGPDALFKEYIEISRNSEKK